MVTDRNDAQFEKLACRLLPLIDQEQVEFRRLSMDGTWARKSRL
jgi:hypothetical protein